MVHVVFAYNCSGHKSTGCTPYELMYASEPRLSSDLVLGPPPRYENVSTYALRQRNILQHAFQNPRTVQDRMYVQYKDHYDLGATTRTFKVGDWVRKKISDPSGNSKLRPKWSRPYKILGIRGPVLELYDPEKKIPFHTHHNKVSNPIRSETEPRPAVIDPNASYCPDLNAPKDSDAESEESDVVEEDPVVPDPGEDETQVSESLGPAPTRAQTRYSLRAKPKPKVDEDFLYE